MTYILLIVLTLSSGNPYSASTVSVRAGGFSSQQACEAAATDFDEQIRAAADHSGWEPGELAPSAKCVSLEGIAP